MRIFIPNLPRFLRHASAITLLVGAGACASATPVSGGQSSSGTPAPRDPGAPRSGTPVSTIARWPVKTEAHVDLWLHSFAMISTDTTPVPLFLRGYRDSVIALKNRANIVTSLDANRDKLANRLRTNPELVQAQFLALGFTNFAELKFASDKFLAANGDVKKASDETTALAITQFATSFRNAADREWLRLFMTSVTEEQSQFYEADYSRALRTRAAVFTAVDSLWQKLYRPKFERFLNNTSQREGELLLSLPLGAEGRTSVGKDRQTIIAVPFPATERTAINAILVFAHESVGTLVSTVVADNTTPAQQRNGETGNFIAFGQVHGGLLLLQKIAPELVEPYARYYLAQGGNSVPGANAAAALRMAYPVPQAVINGLAKQIEIVLAGI